MTASRDIAARLREPHTLDIRNIVEVRAILDLVAVERAEAAAEIASLRLKVEELERRSQSNADHARLANANQDQCRKALQASEARLAALEDQNRALEAATIEKCAETLRKEAERIDSLPWAERFGLKAIALDYRQAAEHLVRALASIPGEA